MIRHYFLIIYRSFLRSKGYFLINLSGLAAGMTCTLLIYLWVKDEVSMNKFHANDKNLYEIMENQQYADAISTTNSTPGLLAESLKAEYPEVEYSATVTWINDHMVSFKDKNVKGRGWDVGSDYFRMFSYNLAEGTPDKVLADKLSMVITKAFAIRLFGTDKDVVGKVVELNHDKSFNITGLSENPPSNSSFQYDFVTPYAFFFDQNQWLKEWGNNGPSTFVVLKDGTDAAAFETKIKDYVKGKNKNSHVTLFLAKFSDLYLYGDFKNGQSDGGRIGFIKLFSVIAIFILLIACINFMNLSTARATRKSKEVGIKKTVGAGRESLVIQYLSESMLTATLALIVSIGVTSMIIPIFNLITEKHIAFDLLDPFLWLWLLGTTLFTGLVAGSYPALYLSGFKPATVLKGDVKGSMGELWARKGLVVFQFFLSVVLIVSVIVVYKQIDFMLTQNLGYEKDHLIQFPREGKLRDNSKFQAFIAEVRKVPGVVDAAAIGHRLVGPNNSTSGLDWPGKDPSDRVKFEIISTWDRTFETVGFQFIEGHPFDGNNPALDTTKIIFNEAAIDRMGLEDPIGKHVRLWDEKDMEIIGVVKNFNFNSMFDPVNPLFFRWSDDISWNVMARLETGKEKDAIEAIRKIHTAINPGFDLDYTFQDKEYAQLYAAEERVANVAAGFATVAIVISCLGLFGLAAFTAERRMKEIGIRKALGSSSTNIVLLLTGDFTRMVIVAIILGLPFAYWVLDLWLSRFAFKIPLSLSYFAAAGALALTIAWITVASQAIRASRSNPVDSLRSE
ncbi:MAG: ABC transporter permease [Bacteroidota bacterium]